MVGTGRIARRRANAAVLLVDQVLVAEPLFGSIAPVLAGDLVQSFGEGFGQPVGQGLGHDRVVIVVVGFELAHQFRHAMPGGDGERAQVVVPAAFQRGDEVGQGVIVLHPLALPLLAQGVEVRQRCLPALVRVEHDVVAQRLGRPEAVHAAGLEQPLFDDLIEQPPSVVVELAGLAADGRVVEDLGVLARAAPTP